MTERMTDDTRRRIVIMLRPMALGGGSDTTLIFDAIVSECDRARAEEARLLEEAKAKDERIQALEKALMAFSVRIHVMGGGPTLPEEVAAILGVSP